MRKLFSYALIVGTLSLGASFFSPVLAANVEATNMPRLSAATTPPPTEAVKVLPQTIEFEGSTYTLLKDDELKSTLSNTEVSQGGRLIKVFESDGGYSFWGGIAPVYGKYRIENSKLCISALGAEQCDRAFYKNKAGEFIGINLFLRDGEKKPYRIRFKPRNQ